MAISADRMEGPGARRALDRLHGEVLRLPHRRVDLRPERLLALGPYPLACPAQLDELALEPLLLPFVRVAVGCARCFEPILVLGRLALAVLLRRRVALFDGGGMLRLLALPCLLELGH